LGNKRRDLDARATRLSSGLDKLLDAQTNVDKLSKELKERQVVVDSKAKEVGEMLERVDTRQQEANRDEIDAQQKKEQLDKDRLVIDKESAEAEASLREAEPALAAADRALQVLTSDKVNEVRALKTPPQKVQFTMYCVYAFKPTGVEGKTVDWPSCKVMMQQTTFLKSLQNFDKSRLTAGMINKA